MSTGTRDPPATVAEDGGTRADPATATRRRISRRRLLEAAVASSVLGAGAYGLSQLGGAAAPRPFRSRPDLDPPPVSVVVPAAETGRGLVFLTASRTSQHQHGPMIVDDGGRLVWFRPVTNGSTNLRVQQLRGRPVVTWWEGEIVMPGYGRGDYVIADTSYRELTRVHAGNGLSGDLHEFVVTPAGTALFTAYRTITADLSPIGGAPRATVLDSLVQEVDIASGEVRFQWSAAAHVPLSDSYLPAPSATADPYDFFHVNSIDVLPNGDLLISSRHTWALYRISRPGGRVVWRVGGKQSTFEVDARGRFAFQHDARAHPGSVITLFDDGAGETQVETRSRGLKLALDTMTMTARFLEEYLPDPTFVASSQGSVQVLPDGNVFVGWGSQPYVSEYRKDATLVFDAMLSDNASSYRAFRFPWTGRPTSPPALAAERAGAATIRAYASWNGATGVERWDVLAGPSASQLEVVGRARRTGFETDMTAHSPGDHVAVQALDASGRVLGRSSVTRI
ncbi:MAG TPA: arylsulfotransferase family protein [Acidimicrobiales bacterium]|nr:arylsulfotransferase family protein [Acidimicrobiales bacterium]